MAEIDWTKAVEATKTASDTLRRALTKMDELEEKGQAIEDCVVLFTSLTEDGEQGTHGFQVGNRYALLGLVEWLRAYMHDELAGGSHEIEEV